MAQSTTTPADAVKAIDRQELKDKIGRRESFVSSKHCRLSSSSTCIDREREIRHPIV